MSSKEYTITRNQLRYLYHKLVNEGLFLNTNERLGAEMLLEYVEDQLSDVDAMRNTNAYIHL